jgi:hypothetical protein
MSPPLFSWKTSRTETQDIIQAAGYLEISEFVLFSLAYRDRYGVDPPERKIDHLFGLYMFSQEVPSWVLMFARRVLKRAEEGCLDPQEFGVKSLMKPKPTLAEWIYLVVGLVVVLFFFYMLLRFGYPGF